MLKDHVILITGGLGRLGQAIVARVEAERGIALATTRDSARAAAFNADAERNRRRARALVFAMRDAEECAELVAAVLTRFGALDGLVNNAYPALAYQDAASTNWAQWQEAARVGLAVPQTLTAEAVRRQAESGIKSVVNIGSVYALVAPDFSIYPDGRDPSPSYYGAMKAALLQLTRYDAAYWASCGVRINAVSPAGIVADQEPEFVARYNAGVPARRMVTRAEVAETVCFLLSSRSSGMLGANLIVDAGRTII